jgi:hypothetical protein
MSGPHIAQAIDDDVAIASTPVLDHGALVGPVGELVQLIEPHTESHPAGLLLATFASVGGLIGRSPYQTIDGTDHRCCLFIVLCGPTSDGRKGTTTRWARRVTRDLDIDFSKENYASGLSSGEGLIAKVRDAVAPAPGIIGHAGVADKRLVVTADELGAAFRKMTGRENTLVHVLRDAWDGQPLGTITKADPMKATDPHIVVIGSITPEELRSVSSEVDFSAGTMNRFLFCWVERTRSLPHGGDPNPKEFARLVARLGRNIITARQVGRMDLDTDGRLWWEAEYEGLTRGHPGRLGQATRRAAPYVRRLAMLYALTSGRASITVPDLDAAMAVWRYAFDSAAFVFGGEELLDPLDRKILAGLEAAGDWMTRTDIRAKIVRSNNLPAATIAKSLTRLRDAGQVRSRSQATAGRSAESWIATRHALRLEKGYGSNGSDGRKVELTSHSSHSSHASLPEKTGVAA